MHTLIQHHLSAISATCAKFGIARLEIYGSGARATDFLDDKSDVDFLVEFLPTAQPGLNEFFGAQSELEKVLGRPVDLTQTSAIRNPFVLSSINQHRELVYVSS